MLTIFLAVIATANLGQSYSIGKLEPMVGYRSFTPLHLNNRGTIVGVNSGSSPDRISLWRDGLHEPLPDLAGDQIVKGLNNKDAVALNVWSSAGGEALLYADGRYLPPLLSTSRASPNIVDLNDSGQVLVIANNTCSVWDGHRYHPIDATDLTYPIAINNSGLVCGVTRLFDPAKQLGFTWQNGEEIKPMGEGQGIGSGLSVLRLNDVGQILVEYNEKSYLWQKGQYQLVASAPHQAWAMNNRGQIIGHTNSADPFIIIEGQITPLARLLTNGENWVLQSVAAINDNGWIIGTGSWNGQRHGFLLKPVRLNVLLTESP
ncbi:MAG: hypothetical protein AAB774_02785 [Patescibacteria group bacterium]